MDVGQFAEIDSFNRRASAASSTWLSWEPDSVALDLFQLSSSFESR